MRAPNCWMPSWTEDGKQIKKGNYCNWESVLAHARCCNTENGEILPKIEEYIKAQVGGAYLVEAPHFSEMEYIKGGEDNYNAASFHAACCYQSDEVCAVKIQESGHIHELLMDTNDGRLDVRNHLKRPQLSTDFCSFQSYRKGKREKDLCVFYYPGKNGSELNALASQLFKMQIHGEVLLVQCTKEPCFMHRERYVHYTMADFNENYMKKRKRSHEQASLAPSEYEVIKAEIQTSLSDYEQQACVSALPPPQLVKLRKAAPIDGKKLAALEKHQRSEVA